MFNAALAGSRKNRGGPTSSVAVMLLSYDKSTLFDLVPAFQSSFPRWRQTILAG